MAAMTSAQRRAQQHAEGRSSTHAASSHVIGGDPCTACYFGAVQAEPLTLGAPLEVGVEPCVKGSTAGGLSAGSRLVPRAQPVFVGVHSPGLGQHQKKHACYPQPWVTTQPRRPLQKAVRGRQLNSNCSN